MSEVRPAFQGNLMLAGWTQSHNAGTKVTFWLESDDDLEAFKHLTTRKGKTAGQRFYAVLIQVGDDEQPINPGEDQPSKKPSRALALSAVQICKADAFHQFVGQARGWFPQTLEQREEQASDYVREYCRVESRSELDTSPTAAQLLSRLMGEYRDWARATGAQT